MRKAEALSKHFFSLAKKHGVKVKRWKKGEGDKGHRGLGGLSDIDKKTIWVPEIRSRTSYAIAMHELGHVLGPWQRKPVLYQEAGAWKWMRENTLQWGRAEEKAMHRGMLSYITAAIAEERCGKKNRLKIPKRSHYFWQCLPPVTNRPKWLSEELAIVPWATVLTDPDRPRCETCEFWEHHHDSTNGDRWGTCLSPRDPMGHTPLVPAHALCGKSYLTKMG